MEFRLLVQQNSEGNIRETIVIMISGVYGSKCKLIIGTNGVKRCSTERYCTQHVCSHSVYKWIHGRGRPASEICSMISKLFHHYKKLKADGVKLIRSSENRTLLVHLAKRHGEKMTRMSLSCWVVQLPQRLFSDIIVSLNCCVMRPAK
jgi:hypothetical protein